MMKATEHIPCDYEKLKKLVVRKGTNLANIAEDAGYTSTWLVKAGQRGWLTPPQIAVLAAYKISREDIAPDPVDEEPEAVASVVDTNMVVVSPSYWEDKLGEAIRRELMSGQLHEVIEVAVVMALSRVRDSMGDMICGAMMDALDGRAHTDE